MPRPQAARQALVMAVDDAFAVGAETSLFSFLRQNPWFDARVMVVSNGLGTQARASLTRLYPVEFVEIAPEILAIAGRLTRAMNLRPGEATRLFSLQLFGLRGLDRAVFMDADTLCTGDVSALFSTSATLAAAPDHLQLERGVGSSCAANGAARHEPYGRPLAFTFNSGVMSVSGELLDPSVYEGLLGLPGMDEVTGSRRLMDQFVLNRYFDGRVTPLDPRYNFLVPSEALLRSRFGLTLPDVRILHFAACPKPWLRDWKRTRTWAPPRFLRYYECWHEARELLSGTLGDEEVLEQQRLGLEELSRAGRAAEP